MSGRRAMLGGAVALLAAGTSTIPAASVPIPDASLIQLSRVLEQEARLFNRTADHGFAYGSQEMDAIDHELNRIGYRLDGLVDAIEERPVTTLAGLQAFAAALVQFDEDLLNEGSTCQNDRLIRHLVKGVLTLRNAA